MQLTRLMQMQSKKIIKFRQCRQRDKIEQLELEVEQTKKKLEWLECDIETEKEELVEINEALK